MKNKRISTIKYLSFFITRAFLIAILILMSFSCLLLVCYFSDYYLNSKNSNKSPLFGAYVIVSKSMVPTINVNDAVVIKRIDNDDYKVGDVITFDSSLVNYNGVAVTHRIIEKEQLRSNESLYTTKGDNNHNKDSSLVETKDIYGKVLFKIPYVGYIQDFLEKPYTYLLALLIPLTMYIVYKLFRSYYSLFRKRRN